MPLYPGGPKVGLGIWYSTEGTIALEAILLISGLGIYLRTTRAVDRVGTIALWAFVAVLLLVYVSSIVGPPPPDWKTLAWAANASWLFILWAGWFDAHRSRSALPRGT
jgi:hypothetical protein